VKTRDQSVVQYHPAFLGEHRGSRDALLLPAGKMVRTTVGEIEQIDPVEGRIGPLSIISLDVNQHRTGPRSRLDLSH
jgi:hypothetical protein